MVNGPPTPLKRCIAGSRGLRGSIVMQNFLKMRLAILSERGSCCQWMAADAPSSIAPMEINEFARWISKRSGQRERFVRCG